MNDHSTEEVEHQPSRFSSKLLHNSGVGRPRNREERIRGNFLLESNTIASVTSLHINLPGNIVDVEDWLKGLLRLAGWKNIEEAISHVPLPNKRLMAFPVKAIAPMPLNHREWIHQALILAKTNEVCYHPGAPLIWTRKRMHRNIQLIDINLDKFYGLD